MKKSIYFIFENFSLFFPNVFTIVENFDRMMERRRDNINDNMVDDRFYGEIRYKHNRRG